MPKRVPLSLRLPSYLDYELQMLVESGKYTTRTDACIQAIREFIEKETRTPVSGIDEDSLRKIIREEVRGIFR